MNSIPPGVIKRRSLGALIAVVGFLLSPLSWWNDLFINVPLALGFAWVVSWFYRDAFTVSFVLGYWLTNILGLVLLQRGGEVMLGKSSIASRRKQWARDLAISLLYTVLILVLVKLRVLAPLPDYFPRIAQP
ncbi:MAG: hypothetical protein U1G07_15005 [Verrucomicrobiota bacterium]